MNAVLTWGRVQYEKIDPKITVCLLLLLYNIFGITFLGFNRSPLQVALTSVSAVALQVFFDFLFYRRFRPSLSAFITGLGLAILVNYGHSLIFLFVPVFFGIASKYFFTFKGKHTFNPGLMGVVLSLVITNEFISPAPAYQWNAGGMMAFLIAIPSMVLFMPRINRHWLVFSWLLTFTAQIVFRSILIRHYLPWNTLFFGTITSPAFFLFTFFMITDPPTTPNTKRGQIIVGIALGLLDLVFHLFSSYHTFFYAAVSLGGIKLVYNHSKAAIDSGSPLSYVNEAFFQSGHYKKVVSIVGISIGTFLIYEGVLNDNLFTHKADFTFSTVGVEKTHFEFSKGDIVEQSDPRVQHMAKWILAITDGVAVADFDNDGLLDVFFTNPHKAAIHRNALFKNMGNFNFKRVPSPELSKFGGNYKKYGVAANGMFVDIDNDGDKDLFLTYAFGKEGTSRMFINMLVEEGEARFVESTDRLGLKRFSNAATANFLDFNRDGQLDIIVGNTIATHLPDYEKPTELNFFELPKAEFSGDRRMFNFMHESWHMANNGGPNFLFINKKNKFEYVPSEKIGIPETRWSMALGTADFNGDGWTDLYVANDFGADDLYYNREGKRFENIKGRIFGSIGKDTYKGMNATVADFDQNGKIDVYISNVHHPLQAEGSLLWTFHEGKGLHKPMIKESATYTGLLNENRFGWGAAAADFNNDGWVDLAQANGMVDDAYDKQNEKCPDYWYVNEKLARSPPSIHRYIDNWGDVRGKCIHGKEKNRLYVNRGKEKRPQFTDVADQIGMNQKGNWRGMAAADFDNDGNVDLIASSLFSNPQVFKNNGVIKEKSKRNWLGLELVSEKKSCNREGVGSKVTVIYKDKEGILQKQFMEKVSVNGFSAQGDPRMHFGLGEGSELVKVHIVWCGQVARDYLDLKANAYQKVIL